MNTDFNIETMLNFESNQINSDEESLLNVESKLDEHLIELSES